MIEKKWMRIYQTIEEAISDIQQTSYEKENFIELTGENKILNDFGDIKIISIGKSTGEKGLCILYKPYLNKERWVVWYPSGNQQKTLPEVAQILKNIDKYNKQFWSGNEST